MKIRKISRRRSRSSDDAEVGHFTLNGKELYIKIYNARAQLLFYSWNLLFGDGLVAVVVVICLNSLINK